MMITKRDIHFMDHVLRPYTASTDKVSGARIGAIITIKNRVIAYGTNQKKTHPFQALHGKNANAIYLHAEIDAIKNALREIDIDDFRRATLYVARLKNSTSDPRSPLIYGLAKPCKHGCAQAIVKFGLKRAVYSLDGEGFEIL